MIEKILVCSFVTFAIWYTMLDGEIFGKIGAFLRTYLPGRLQDPVVDCPVCMGFWYGSIVYWIVYHESLKEWIIVGFCVIGLNTIIVKMWPENE